MNVLRRYAWVALVAAPIGVAACGSSVPPNEFPRVDSGLSDAGAGAGDSGLSIPATDGGRLDPDAFVGCTDATSRASKTPLHYVVLVDRSGSMCFRTTDGVWDCPSTATRWSRALPALATFFSAPTAVGSAATVLAFPADDACGTVASPAAAEVSLPDAASVLVGRLAAHPPTTGNTPTRDAVAKALSYARTQMAALRDGGRTVLIVVTDGQPQDCAEGPSPSAVSDDVGNLLAGARSSDGLASYVVGLSFGDPALEGNLATIASGAGTAPIFVTTPNAVEQQLTAALAAIRQQNVACEYLVPAPPSGQTLDPTRVNVEYDPGDGAPKSVLARSQDCAVAGGWRYDDPLAPTKVLLCPEACTAAVAKPQAAVSVLFGCTTVDAKR